jgi:3'-phosphoadenosine 5'-phosphosulfate (PAPS) 3'-phosphatase
MMTTVSIIFVLFVTQHTLSMAFQSIHSPSYNHKQLFMTTPKESGLPGSLQLLCTASLKACALMTPLITTIYNDLSKNEVKTKQDNSAFTIADGLVQQLIYVLFTNVQFRDIVGEEDATVNDSWDQVDGLSIPNHIIPIVHSTKKDIESLADTLSGDYSTITVFIDPIDGTKEFSTGNGEQCSICIGFADVDGTAVGGVVYRPLTAKPTWAVGAKSESYSDHSFVEFHSDLDGGGLLTSNGSISPFIESLIDELNMKRTKAGGAGNKMLLLLEQSLKLAREGCADDFEKNCMLYIQDRGVSRWDTCAAEAVLEAFGGRIFKLTFVQYNADVKKDTDERRRYTYLASETNLDFNPLARCTKYNSYSYDVPSKIAHDAMKPYSNLCGLVAFGKECNFEQGLRYISDAIQRAAHKNAPSYD